MPSILQGDYAFGRGQSRLGVSKKQILEKEFVVYPNPVSVNNELQILNMSNEKSPVALLFSETGALVSNQILINKLESINTSRLTEGMYKLVITNQEKVIHAQNVVIAK